MYSLRTSYVSIGSGTTFVLSVISVSQGTKSWLRECQRNGSIVGKGHGNVRDICGIWESGNCQAAKAVLFLCFSAFAAFQN